MDRNIGETFLTKKGADVVSTHSPASRYFGVISYTICALNLVAWYTFHLLPKEHSSRDRWPD